MAKLYALSRQTRAGMFFTLPVFLVTARLLVHMLFTGVYRLWARTREGYQAIQQVREHVQAWARRGRTSRHNAPPC